MYYMAMAHFGRKMLFAYFPYALYITICRSKAWVCGRSPAEIVGSNPTGGMDVCRECCVLSGSGLCDELISRPEAFHRLWCVGVCDLDISCVRRTWPTGGCRAPPPQKCTYNNNKHPYLYQTVSLFLQYCWLFVWAFTNRHNAQTTEWADSDKYRLLNAIVP
jgi:hypothetical protein